MSGWYEPENPVWAPEPKDSTEVFAIKRLLRESWEANDREHGFQWNRDAHGLMKALRALQEIPDSRRSEDS